MSSTYLIVIPTYNEKDNIAKLIKNILELLPKINILVVDDNSPDNTAQLVENISQINKNVHLLKRHGKMGLGTAYCAGFRWGIKHGFNYFISMDADFSHPVKNLAQMIELSQKNPNSIISGSRYVRGGKIEGWNLKKHLNSRLANIVTRLFLGFKIKDVTSGYKCYPASFINQIDLNKVVSSGYAFMVEMVFLAKLKKVPIIEFPITFVDRQNGESKIAGELKKSAKIVFYLVLQRFGLRKRII